jgi:cell division transport system ATP-binding protein
LSRTISRGHFSTDVVSPRIFNRRRFSSLDGHGAFLMASATPRTPPVVRFADVRKRYAGGVECLRGVSFAVDAGEMVFLTGPSGAGKTTLLRMVAAIERPSSGVVEVQGQDISRLRHSAIPYLRRNLGLVMQDQRLLFDRSVFDNVMLPLAVGGYSHREGAGRVRAALDKVGLLGREKSNPAVLSAGEQQRVSIARALVCRPRLLVADEPTANVDAEYGVQIFEIFRAFNQVGVTVLVASHDRALVERFASRVVRVSEGVVLP